MDYYDKRVINLKSNKSKVNYKLCLTHGCSAVARCLPKLPSPLLVDSVSLHGIRTTCADIHIDTHTRRRG